MNLGLTVEDLKHRITSREFAEWQAYDQVEPFGEERADFRAGTIAAATVNLWRKRADLATPGDFMINFPDLASRTAERPEPETVTGGDRRRELEFVAAMGARHVAK